jgi:adenylate kinase family enzyme
VIRERLAVYRRQTEPLIGYYRQQGVLRMVASIGSPDEVNDAVQAVLKETF